MASKTTTPQEISLVITEFCLNIAPKAIPNFVEVHPHPESQPNECFYNVDAVVQKHGGHRILGWCIWKWANVLIEAEAHAVWQSPEGNLIDVTPHTGNESKILFLPDESMVYVGEPLPNHRKALTNSPLTAELITLCEEHEGTMVSTPGKQYSIAKDSLKRRLELTAILSQSAGRNDPCPCQSGLKYKKCCGR